MTHQTKQPRLHCPCCACGRHLCGAAALGAWLRGLPCSAAHSTLLLAAAQPYHLLLLLTLLMLLPAPLPLPLLLLLLNMLLPLLLLARPLPFRSHLLACLKFCFPALSLSLMPLVPASILVPHTTLNCSRRSVCVCLPLPHLAVLWGSPRRLSGLFLQTAPVRSQRRP
jgi:hypothetical protein